jgi:phosphopantetheine--protein transferase-like protein
VIRADVRVFEVDLDQPASVVGLLDAFLDAGEREAAGRIRVARAATRIVVGEALGIDPGRVPISRRCAHCGDRTHGRPTVSGNDEISFSLSHSGGYAVIALADGGAHVGVDVEAVRPRLRLDALAARVLSDEEHSDWRAIDDADGQLRSFLRAWTAKEAYLKALGIGIATPLRDVPSSVEGWSMRALDVGSDRVGALAVDRTEIVVRHAPLPPMPPGYRDVVLDAGDDRAPIAPIERFRRTSLGTVFAAGLFGLRDVLEPPKDETPAIVENWAGGEPFNEPIVMRLDPDHPEDSIVMVRPWLNRKPRD